jgi:hypothetical protein
MFEEQCPLEKVKVILQDGKGSMRENERKKTSA